MVLTEEQFQNTSQEELESSCESWKRHVEYDLVFSDLRTNEIYVSVSRIFATIVLNSGTVEQDFYRQYSLLGQ